MPMNWGSFAGGAADGYRKQNDDMRRSDENARQQNEVDRRRKADEREETYRKEVEGLQTPDAAYKARMAEYEKARRSAEIEASTASTAARIMTNPAAGGISSAPATPSTFAEDMEQRGVDNPLIAMKPASSSNIIATNGIGAGEAMQRELVKPERKAAPEAPATPGLADMFDYTTKRAAIDMKYGKMDGQGIMQLAMARKQFEDEGMRDALLKIHGGDVQGGINEFNQSGQRRVKLIDAKQVEADIGGIKMPTNVVTVEDENGNRQTINAAQILQGYRKMENQLQSTLEMMKFQQNARHQNETAADSREYHRGVAAAAQTRAENSGGLTVPQQRTNEEIEAAREYIGSLSQDEIRRRTAQYGATGRENPDYDQLLASKVRLANHRKYGEDTDFSKAANAAAEPQQGDINAKFTADPAMKGHRLGNKTQHGAEVFDINGKLIGYYN